MMWTRFILFLSIVWGVIGTPARAEFVIVPVEGTIDGGLAAFIERVVSNVKPGTDGIIFHINTPGGRIDSAVDIKDTILNAKMPTIAFVDKSAISAGAVISLACDSIYMTTGSSIGAATAVDLEGKKASEKIISYFRAQMRATAEAKGRRADIAEAMVDEQIEVKGINKKGMLITLTYSEALKYDISDGTVETIDGVLSFLGKERSPVVWIKPNWAENIVRFLTHPIVSSLLISLGFLGLIIEIKTPGWGLGGTLALIALALFFGSHWIVHLAGIGELLLFGGGVILLAVEIFVIPGFGVVGVTGIALILVSLYLSLVGHMPRPEDITIASYSVTGAFFLTILGGYVVFKMFPRTPLFSKLTLETVESSGKGYISAETSSDLIGKAGNALSDLRPSGIADINGQRLDVVTEGEYIEKGTKVVVVEVKGSRIVVKKK